MAFTIKRFSLAFATVTLASIATMPTAHADAGPDEAANISVASAAVTPVIAAPTGPSPLSDLSFNLDNQDGTIGVGGEAAPAEEYLPSQIRNGNFGGETLNPLNTVPRSSGDVAAYREGTGYNLVNQNEAEFGEISEISGDVFGPRNRIRQVNRAASFRITL